MITKTKLSEEQDALDILLERMSTLHDEIYQVSEKQHQLTDTMMDFVVMIDSMVKILSEKNVFTEKEFRDKIDEVTKVADTEKFKVLQETKVKSLDKYFTWLLTKSKDYGNS